MMNDIKSIKEIFSRLFLIALQKKMNLYSFTFLLQKSDFINKIEHQKYDNYFNKPIEEIFTDITSYPFDKDDSYGIYNDAYWSGSSYFELYMATKKPFSYIFLKLPLSKMVDLYPLYHEMDFSSLLELFKYLENEYTILYLLVKNKNISLPKLSKITGIKLSTLRMYYSSDSSLYKASFQNIIKLVNYFEVPLNLFIEKY